MANVCDVLIERLTDAGVRHIFGVPGDAINTLLESIRRQDAIKFIHVNHEESGAFAASATAKLTGNLGVCCGTAGPGAIHLLNGLYDAKLDHAPVLAITGQIETKMLGTDYQQEVDLHALFEPVSTYNQMIVNADQMPFVATRAIQTALNTRSVCHLNIPLDIASEKVSEPHAWPLQNRIPSWPQEDLQALDNVVDLINSAQDIAILAGVGCRGAEEDVLTLADQLNAPVIHSLRAKELFPESHPLSIGGLGNLGIRPAVEAMENCDLLLLLGTDFPYVDYLPHHAKVIQIDINPTQIGKRLLINAGLAGDVGPILQKMIPRLKARNFDSFLRKIQSSKEKWHRQENSDIEPSLRTIKPQRLAHLIGVAADSSTIFVCDTGEVTAWTARYLQMQQGQRFIVSGLLASMAFALPGAIGAQLAYPERCIVALVGDGGFSMLMTDFSTAVKYQLPIVFIIFNNRRLGMIQLEQEAKGYRNFETDMHNPDFAAFAKICGGNGLSVTEPDQLEDGLQQAFASHLPFVLDVMIDADEIPVPPALKLNQTVNYGIAKIKEFVD